MIKNLTNKDLLKQLISDGVLKSKQVIFAMQRTDRKNYAPNNPYSDCPQSIGYGATISAPHMHAYALEFLRKHLLKALNVLDVGSGTGYLTAAMALIVPEKARIFAIQHVPQLVKSSIKNIQKDNPELLKGKVTIKVGDGRKGWIWDENMKFDVIHVGAAPQKVPEQLIAQMAEGGRMVIPVGKQNGAQEFLALDKIEGKIVKTYITGVRYVPLTDLQKQIQNE